MPVKRYLPNNLKDPGLLLPVSFCLFIAFPFEFLFAPATVLIFYILLSCNFSGLSQLITNANYFFTSSIIVTSSDFNKILSGFVFFTLLVFSAVLFSILRKFQFLVTEQVTRKNFRNYKTHTSLD